jgi:hypothetical protein
MAARRKTRAARRIKERTRRNALAREAAAEIAEEQKRPKLKNARHKTQLELLASRGNIREEHHKAGARLARDYAMSKTIPTALIGRYEANMPRPPKKYQAPNDAPSSIAARERYDAAMAAVGPFLNGILFHVCVVDLPVAEWGPLNGRAKSHGVPVLYSALDALCWHYGSGGDRRQAA